MTPSVRQGSTPQQEDSPLHSPVTPYNNFKSAPKPSIISRGALQGSKMENVRRCLELLDHLTECRRGGGACAEGEGCRRTKQVLFHHMNCSNQQTCSICLQLLQLCRMHGAKCKKEPKQCEVPHCPNSQQLETNMNQNKMDTTPNAEERKEVMKCLENALQKPSVEEKKEEILQLLQKYPVVAGTVLRDIYKIKMNKTRLRPMSTHQGLPEMVERRLRPTVIASTSSTTRPVPNLYVANFKMFPIVKQEPISYTR